MFDNRHRGLFKFGRQLGGGGKIENIIVRKFLAVKLLEVPEEIAVQRRLLVWVLAVPQVLRFLQ